MSTRIMTHNKRILETIYYQGEKTATDFSYVSNANQYFGHLYHLGLLQWRWGKKGNKPVKYWSIPEEKRKQAYHYFSK